MPDPFQDVSGADPEMIGIMVDALEARAADPQMIAVIDAYLDAVEWPEGGLLLEIGAGTGGISRRMAARYANGRVLGIEPSPQMVAEAQRLADGIDNLSFEVGDGAALGRADGSADIVVLHTVLSHVPEPMSLLVEAHRVLGPGGQLVVCEADFAKTSLGNVVGDPMQACADCIRENFVTSPWLVPAIRGLIVETGFEIAEFGMTARLDLGGGSGRSWVRMASAYLLGAGVIGRELADALLAEYARRAEAGTVYGFLPFATAIARKPA